VNRLQARLDEEEFGDPTITAPSELKTGSSGTETLVAEETSPEAQTSEMEEGKADEPPQNNCVGTKNQADNTHVSERITDEVDDSGKDILSTKTVASVESTERKDLLEMTFAEKKAARAQRFKIPIFKHEEQRRKDRNQRFSDEKRNHCDETQGEISSNKKVKTANDSLLPKEEIEKRLKRLQKFEPVDQEEVDSLKAMQRKYRFQQ